jgi:hypothetical protein
LRAIGDAAARVAAGRAGSAELDHIERWTAQIGGRGACHHPDGAVQLMASALDVFGDEFRHHARTGPCSITGSRIEAAQDGRAPPGRLDPLRRLRPVR